MASTNQPKCRVCMKLCFDYCIDFTRCCYCKDKFHNQCISPDNHDDWLCQFCLAILFPFNWIEDDIELTDSLVAHSNPTSINARVIKNFVQLRLTNSHKPSNKDMDPDKNYFCFLDHIGCNYYLEVEFNHLVYLGWRCCCICSGSF
jgi:hypothetical protein